MQTFEPFTVGRIAVVAALGTEDSLFHLYATCNTVASRLVKIETGLVESGGHLRVVFAVGVVRGRHVDQRGLSKLDVVSFVDLDGFVVKLSLIRDAVLWMDGDCQWL